MRRTKHRGILVRAQIERSYFDPTDPDDQLAYLIFMRTGRWIKQFYYDPSHGDANVVTMIQRKLLEHLLSDQFF